MKSTTLRDSGADLALFVRRHPWLTGLAGFVAACVVVFFCLEWRAEQRWQQYALEARARGVKLLLTDFAPPEIPEAQNFAALPMWPEVMATEGKSNPFKWPERLHPPTGKGTNVYSTPVASTPPTLGEPLKGKRIDWVEWQKYFQAAGWLESPSDNAPADTLRALEHYQPAIAQWREWKTRRQSRFPLDLAKGADLPLPHLGTLQSAIKVFALRMRAHLALHDSAAAYDDFQDALQAYRAVQQEPTLISGLVRISILAVTINAMGDGLQDRAWADAELRQIESALAAIHLWEDYRLALTSERGFSNATTETWMNASLQKRRQIWARYEGFMGSRSRESQVIPFLPRSIFRANQLRSNQYFDELTAQIARDDGSLNPDLPTPSSADHLSTDFEKTFYFLFLFSTPVYRDIERRYLKLQIMLDEARLACALERFRLAQGSYPAALPELTPTYLRIVPTDVYSREPYHYQRSGESSFRLYSVGENRKDDGGLLVPGVSESRQPDILWLYAPTTP